MANVFEQMAQEAGTATKKPNVFEVMASEKPEEYTGPMANLPEEKKGFFSRENLGETLKTFLAIKNPVARAEAFANYVSKEFATVASGYTGLAAGAAPGVDEEGGVYNLPGTAGLMDPSPRKFDLDKAQKALEVTQEGLTYEPRTEGGKIISKAIEAPFEVVSKPIQKFSGYLGGKAEEAGGPEAGALTETVVQGVPVVVATLLGIKGGKTLTPTRAAIRADRRISNMINTGINKSVKPSTAGKKTAAQVAKYKKRAREAVISITENLDNLKLIDEAGMPVSGTPKNLKQFSQAVEQTKRLIFEEYDNLTKQANKKGIEISPDSAIKELETVVKRRDLIDHAPATVRYAQKKIEALREGGSYTALEAQNSIRTLNQSKDNFYANRTSQNAGKAHVDALVANHIRRELDKAIKAATGKEYQALKNKYGSLSEIEADVTKASIRDANKSKAGLVDFTDVFTSFHIAEGLFKLDPATMAAGAAARGAKNYIKFLNDPNRRIKNMFSGVEKNLGKLRVAEADILRLEAKRAESTPIPRERPETSTTPSTEPPGGIKLPRSEYTQEQVSSVLAIREGKSQGRVLPKPIKTKIKVPKRKDYNSDIEYKKAVEKRAKQEVLDVRERAVLKDRGKRRADLESSLKKAENEVKKGRRTFERKVEIEQSLKAKNKKIITEGKKAQQERMQGSQDRETGQRIRRWKDGESKRKEGISKAIEERKKAERYFKEQEAKAKEAANRVREAEKTEGGTVDVTEGKPVNLLNVLERERYKKRAGAEAKKTGLSVSESMRERSRLAKRKAEKADLTRAQKKGKKKGSGPPKRKYEGAKPWEDTRVLSYEQRNTLKALKADLAAGENPNLLVRKGKAGTGGVGEYSRTPSTNPEWFKNKGWTKKEVNEVIRKATTDTKAKQKLGKRQKQILEDLMEEVDNYAYNQLTPEEQSFIDRFGWKELELREINRRIQDSYYLDKE